MKRTLLASIAVLAFTVPAFATNSFCDEQTVKVGEIEHFKTVEDFGPVKKFVGSTVGKDGWDGIGGQCTKPGSSRIWVGPRDANGVCLTPASIVGTVDGAVFKTVIEKVGEHDELDYVEDVMEDQYREGELDKKEYGKAVLKELFDAINEHRAPNPIPKEDYVNWGDWDAGNC